MQELAPKLQNRFQSLDFLRGIALLGILLMNIDGFSFPMAQYQHFTDFTGINYNSWWAVMVLAEGTMRGLFSILFGASCMLILSKTESINSVDIYYRRLFWLFLFGLFNAYILLWDGDILYGYAIAGMFLFPFRKLQPKWLIIIGVVLALGTFGRSVYTYQTQRIPTYKKYEKAMTDSTKLHKKLTKQQKEDISKFKESIKYFDKDTAAINSQIRTMRGNYKAVFDKRWKDGEQFQKWTLYDLVFWDEIMMMLIGMGLFKLGVLTNKISTKNYGWMLLLGYSIGLFLRIRFVNSIFWDEKGLINFINTYTINTRAYYDISRIAMTIGHIGLLMLLYRSSWFNWLVKIISKVGQMALSNYLLQSMLCGLYFYGFGFGMFAKLQIHQNYLFCGAIWLICIVFSNIWLRFFQFGPFEWLWRSLTYWQKQPFTKENN